MSPRRPYKVIASEHLWRSHWYSLRQDRLRATDGSEVTYTVVDKPAAVWVVPVTAEGMLVLINQYRYPVDDWCLEVPAGNVEVGCDPAEMAARELREEIGGSAAQIIPIATFYTMNGIGNEIAWVFLALGVRLGQPSREPTEHMEVCAVPIAEALRMARTGQIKDGPSALAILLCAAELGAVFPEGDI
jgi:ADP-ribose pyrophosphatase